MSSGDGRVHCAATTKWGGQACKRLPVTGSKFCAAHGGIEKSDSPAAVRQKWDRPRQHCTATTAAGQPCKAWAVAGSDLCNRHGDGAPSIKQLAKERLFALLPTAIKELERILRSPTAKDSDKLKAAEMLLNRTGFGPRATLDLETKQYEEVLGVILVDAPEDYKAVESNDFNARDPKTGQPIRVIDADPDGNEFQARLDAEAQAAIPDASVIPIAREVAVHDWVPSTG